MREIDVLHVLVTMERKKEAPGPDGRSHDQLSTICILYVPFAYSVYNYFTLARLWHMQVNRSS